MRILAVRVRDFRRLTGRTAVEGLEPGLNVITGDNEEGKSTLLAAIRTVVFERHAVSGSVATGFLPFGSRVRPEIEIEIEIGGRAMTLRKAFCQSPEAELRTAEGTFTGSAAEEELARLLRIDVPARGASKAEHRGVWGLFWVEQGETASTRDLSLSRTAQTTLQVALEQEVGEVLGGREGAHLLAAIEARRGKFFGKSGRPVGQFAKRAAELARLQTRLTDVESELALYEERVERLGEDLARLVALDASGETARTAEALAAAEQEHARVAALRSVLQGAHKDQELALAEHTRLTARAERRKADAAAVAAQQQTLARLDEELAAGSAGLRQRTAEQKERARRRDQAREAHGRALAERARAERVVDLARIAAEAREGEARLARAELAYRETVEARRAADAVPVGEREVDALRDAERTLREANARLDGAATHITFRLRPEIELTVDGEASSPDGERSFTGPAIVRMEGVGEILVAPGGEDLQRRVEACSGARARLAELLGKAGVRNVDDAIVLMRERRSLLAAADAADRVLQVHAPRGLPALREEVARTRERIAVLTAERTGDDRQLLLGVDGFFEAPDREEAEAQLGARAVEAEAAREALLEAEAAYEEAREGLDRRREELARREGQRPVLARATEELAARLAADRTELADEELARATALATARLADATRAVEEAQAALAAADPERVAAELAAAREADSGARGTRAGLVTAVQRARDWLEGRGHAGLGEERDDLAARVAQLAARVERDEREARAIDLLHRVLCEAAQEAKQTFASPIQSRVQAYVERLLPGASLEIDQDLTVEGIRRGPHVEPFRHLSHGTREQLAVLTRLAFADLLREHGHPPPLLLDDALVYSDDERFGRMKEILVDAARRLQIVVLTCRARDWQDVPATHLRLQEAREEG